MPENPEDIIPFIPDNPYEESSEEAIYMSERYQAEVGGTKYTNLMGIPAEYIEMLQSYAPAFHGMANLLDRVARLQEEGLLSRRASAEATSEVLTQLAGREMWQPPGPQQAQPPSSQEVIKEFTSTGRTPQQLVHILAQYGAQAEDLQNPSLIRNVLESHFSPYGWPHPSGEEAPPPEEWYRTGTSGQLRYSYRNPKPAPDDPSKWEPGHVSRAGAARQWPAETYMQSYIGIPGKSGKSVLYGKDPRAADPSVRQKSLISLAKYLQKPLTSPYSYPEIYSKGGKSRQFMAPMPTSKSAGRYPVGVRVPMVLLERELIGEGGKQAPPNFIGSARTQPYKDVWFAEGQEPTFAGTGTMWESGEKITPYLGSAPMYFGPGSTKFLGAKKLGDVEKTIGDQGVPGQMFRLQFEHSMSPSEAQLMWRVGLFKAQLNEGQQVIIPGYENYGAGAPKDPTTIPYSFFQAHPKVARALRSKLGIKGGWRETGHALSRYFYEGIPGKEQSIFDRIAIQRRAIIPNVQESLIEPEGGGEPGSYIYPRSLIERTVKPRNARPGQTDIITKPMTMLPGHWFAQPSVNPRIRQHRLPLRELETLGQDPRTSRLHDMILQDASQRNTAYAGVVNAAMYNIGAGEMPSGTVSPLPSAIEIARSTAKERLQRRITNLFGEGESIDRLGPGAYQRAFLEELANMYGDAPLAASGKVFPSARHMKRFSAEEKYMTAETSKAVWGMTRAMQAIGSAKEAEAVEAGAYETTNLALGKHFFERGRSGWSERVRGGALQLSSTLPENTVVMPERELALAMGGGIGEKNLQRYRSGEWKPGVLMTGQPAPGEIPMELWTAVSSEYAKEAYGFELENMGQRIGMNPLGAQRLGRDQDGDYVWAIAGEVMVEKDGELQPADITSLPRVTRESVRQYAQQQFQFGRPWLVRGEQVGLKVDIDKLHNVGVSDVESALKERAVMASATRIGSYYNTLEDLRISAGEMGRPEIGTEVFQRVHGVSQAMSPLKPGVKKAMDLMSTATWSGWGTDILTRIGEGAGDYERTYSPGVSSYYNVAEAFMRSELPSETVAQTITGGGDISRVKEMVDKFRAATPEDQYDVLSKSGWPGVLGDVPSLFKQSPLGGAYFGRALEGERRRLERKGLPFQAGLGRDVPKERQESIIQEALNRQQRFRARRVAGSKYLSGREALIEKVQSESILGKGLSPYLSDLKQEFKPQQPVQPEIIGATSAPPKALTSIGGEELPIMMSEPQAQEYQSARAEAINMGLTGKKASAAAMISMGFHEGAIYSMGLKSHDKPDIMRTGNRIRNKLGSRQYTPSSSTLKVMPPGEPPSNKPPGKASTTQEQPPGGGSGGINLFFRRVSESDLIDAVNEMERELPAWAERTREAREGTARFTSELAKQTKAVVSLRSKIESATQLTSQEIAGWGGEGLKAIDRAVAMSGRWSEYGVPAMEGWHQISPTARALRQQELWGGGPPPGSGGGLGMWSLVPGGGRIAQGADNLFQYMTDYWNLFRMRRIWGMTGGYAMSAIEPAAQYEQQMMQAAYQAQGGVGVPELGGMAEGLMSVQELKGRSFRAMGRSFYDAYEPFLQHAPQLGEAAGPLLGALGVGGIAGVLAGGISTMFPAAAGLSATGVGIPLAAVTALYAMYRSGVKTFDLENPELAVRAAYNQGRPISRAATAAGMFLFNPVQFSRWGEQQPGGVTPGDWHDMLAETGVDIGTAPLSELSLPEASFRMKMYAQELTGRFGPLRGFKSDQVADYASSYMGLSPYMTIPEQIPEEHMRLFAMTGVGPSQYANQAEQLGMPATDFGQLVDWRIRYGAGKYRKAISLADQYSPSKWWMSPEDIMSGLLEEDIGRLSTRERTAQAQYSSLAQELAAYGEEIPSWLEAEKPDVATVAQMRWDRLDPIRRSQGAYTSLRGNMLGYGIQMPTWTEAGRPDLDRTVQMQRRYQIPIQMQNRFGVYASSVESVMPSIITPGMEYEFGQFMSGNVTLPRLQQISSLLGAPELMQPEYVTRGPAGMQIGTMAPLGYGMTMDQFSAGYGQAEARLSLAKETGDFMGSVAGPVGRGLTWPAGSLWDIQERMTAQQTSYSQTQAGISAARIQAQRAYYEKIWPIQDAQMQLGYIQQMGGTSPAGNVFTGAFNWQEQQLQMNYGYNMAGMGISRQQLALSREQRGLQRGYQIQDLNWQSQTAGINYGRALTTRGWTQEDWAFQSGRMGREFGWQMEDYEEAIRFATGRQRKRLITRQERDVIRYGEERSRFETEKERQRERWGWEDEDHQRQMKRLAERRKRIEEIANLQERGSRLQEERLNLQEKRTQEVHQMQMEQLEERKAAYQESYDLQKEQRDATREYQEESLDLAESAAGAAAEHAKKMRELQEEYNNARRAQQTLLSEWQMLMLEGLARFLEELDPEAGGVFRGYMAHVKGSDSKFHQSPR